MSSQADFRSKFPEIAAICRRYAVRELSLFGSALGPNFRVDSDLDFLVDFHPDARIGLLEFTRLQHELEAVLHRHVDLVPKRGLKPLIRDSVLGHTELVYAG